KGFTDIIDITPQVLKAVKESRVKDGICLVFVAHSTCAVTTIEYEEGVM
ncbi:MAG: secondary thiamine-phosphate synthase enzyme, partial [Candidatus Nealsonbacteria bacterium CG18_big_fil_WC_8_21_14_2_50_37_10]